MPGMDVFNQDAFSMQQLTAALLEEAHVPMRLGEMGLFQSEGVRTLDVSVERQDNSIVLVQTTARNSPGQQNTKDDRFLTKIPTSRIALDDAVTADEVQGVRGFGSESDLDSLVEEVNRRNLRMDRSITATEEHMRIGALKGTVVDADGSTLIDLFDRFDVTAETERAFDLANKSGGALRTFVQGIIRTIEDGLGGLPYTGVHAMCSSGFYDALLENAEVRENRLNTERARSLDERTARRAFDFAGVTWEEYRGSVGGTAYVEADKVHIFPLGVPDMFLSRYAPAEFWNTVNTVGLPRYAVTAPDAQFPESRRMLRVQTQCLHICTRPALLIPGRKGA